MRRFFLLLSTAVVTCVSFAQEHAVSDALEKQYTETIQPLLDEYCFGCHEEDRAEADVDLAAFESLVDIRRDTRTWIRVRAMLDSAQMPPKKSDQPSDVERATLLGWVTDFLTREAEAHAGDPGPVVLRRLNNAEYNYTLRDLTGIDSLDPTREFPVDGAAGEGFTNSGNAQGMSPSMVQKYLDAAKEVSSHMVLLPDGIAFSRYNTRRDHSDELVKRIQAFYRHFTETGGGSKIVVEGMASVHTNEGGVIPIETYLEATLVDRDALVSGTKTIEDVARGRKLNAKYLQILWEVLSVPGGEPSFLLDPIRELWRTATPSYVPAIASAIVEIQEVVWKFNPVGHIGVDGRPSAWMVPTPLVRSKTDYEVALPEVTQDDVRVCLVASDAGDGNENDYVVWDTPRLVRANESDILLRDLAGLEVRVGALQRETLGKTAEYLAAATHVRASGDLGAQALSTLSNDRGLDVSALGVWLEYLAVGDVDPVPVAGHHAAKFTSPENDAARGWSTSVAIVATNISDKDVKIPGLVRPGEIVVHPGPGHYSAAGWQSPITGFVRVEATITDAHPECGNGQEWFVRHHTNRRKGILWQGVFSAAGESATMSSRTLLVRKGELVTFEVGPKERNYFCDLTRLEFAITEVGGEERVWNLAEDVSGDLQAGNPHADRLGNTDVWHFYLGAVDAVVKTEAPLPSMPGNSILAKWWIESDEARRIALAEKVQEFALGDAPADENSPDFELHRQLQLLALSPGDLEPLLDGVEPDERFGRHPLGHAVEPSNLVVRAPSITEFRIPAKLAEGRKLLVTGLLDETHGREGSVRVDVRQERFGPDALTLSIPMHVHDDSSARRRIQASFDEFRRVFPARLCYLTIVPVDEVVTINLFYRQDEALKQLFLSEEDAAHLEELWDHLFFVSQEPLQYQVSFEQRLEFATQGRPDWVALWTPLKPSVDARAHAFRERLVSCEPAQLQSVVDFTGSAWRRPLSEPEEFGIRASYAHLRAAEISHEEALRLTLARVLTSPRFLYRREEPGPGLESIPVSSLELASRLSYFLWSSAPDAELRRVAETGALVKEDVLVEQARRMLKDARTKRLAVQFACQWLHVRDFDQNDDKNEKLYPEFSDVRDDMYEETVRFFEDMFRNDGSILGMIDADHTFLNETLAELYGIEGISGSDWRRVEGVRAQRRGGVLAMATILASQSGASRTSPILRGNWIYETLLGERLPRPPPDVPQIPDEPPGELTARQLIEMHSSTPACAKCHAKIDPYGFALEQYDAIGRLRSEFVDTKTTLVDGREIEGIEGLRKYLTEERRRDVLRQFCRKLLGYALGREVQLSDTPFLDGLIEKLGRNGYRFIVAVEAVVASPQFREIRGAAVDSED